MEANRRPEEAGTNNLKSFLEPLMAERNLSLRRVAKEVGVDPATLSRILTGKIKPRPKLLAAVAECVGADYEQLLVAAGYLPQRPVGLEQVVGSLLPEDGVPPGILGDRETLRREIGVYERYASTPEGERQVREGFLPKLREIRGLGRLLDQLDVMFRYFVDPESPQGPKIALGAALLYFIVVPDLVPDMIFPLGYLDDALVVTLIWSQWQQVLTDYSNSHPH